MERRKSALKKVKKVKAVITATGFIGNTKKPKKRKFKTKIEEVHFVKNQQYINMDIENYYEQQMKPKEDADINEVMRDFMQMRD
jgi:preprotein translocase subunit YajC